MCKNRMPVRVRMAAEGLYVSSYAHVPLPETCNLQQPATFVALGGHSLRVTTILICTFAQAKCLAYLWWGGPLDAAVRRACHGLNFGWGPAPPSKRQSAFPHRCEGYYVPASCPWKVLAEAPAPASAPSWPLYLRSWFVCLLFRRRLLSNYSESKANVWHFWLILFCLSFSIIIPSLPDCRLIFLGIILLLWMKLLGKCAKYIGAIVDRVDCSTLKPESLKI